MDPYNMDQAPLCINCRGQPTQPPCYNCTFKLSDGPVNTQSNFTSPSSTWYHNNASNMSLVVNNGHLNNYSMQSQHVVYDSNSKSNQNLNHNWTLGGSSQEDGMEADDHFSNEITMLTEKMSIHDIGAKQSQGQPFGSWTNGIAQNIQMSLEVASTSGRQMNPTGSQNLPSAIGAPYGSTDTMNNQHYCSIFTDMHGA